MVRNLEHPKQSDVCYLNVILQFIANTLLAFVIIEAEECSNDNVVKSLKTFVQSYHAPELKDDDPIKTEYVREVCSMLL